MIKKITKFKIWTAILFVIAVFFGFSGIQNSTHVYAQACVFDFFIDPNNNSILSDDFSCENEDVIIKNFRAFGKEFILSGEHYFKDITIIDSVVISKQLEPLIIHADNIYLLSQTSPSIISVTGKGYSGGTSGACRYNFLKEKYFDPQYGQGPGGGGAGWAADEIGSNGGGGSYGGEGGSSGGATGGVLPYYVAPTYGNEDMPLDFGSGGGGGTYCVTTSYNIYKNGFTNIKIDSQHVSGGNGGGAIALYVANELKIDNRGVTAYISANGRDGVETSLAGAGGGSGGSIYIEAGTIKLQVEPDYFPFRAVGGMGSIGQGCKNWSFDGGGGGGGRVAIKAGQFVDLDNQLIAVEASDIITVAGGGYYGGLGTPGAGGTAEGTGKIIIPAGNIKVYSNKAMQDDFIISGPQSYSGRVTEDEGTVTVAEDAPVGNYSITCPSLSGYIVSSSVVPSDGVLTENGELLFSCNYTEESIPVTYNYSDFYNYSADGILIYTSADSSDYGNMNATVAAGGEIIYTLTIINPHQGSHTINLRFELPAGFSYQGMVAGPDADQIIGFTGPGNLTWQNYEALAGESSISFKVKVP